MKILSRRRLLFVSFILTNVVSLTFAQLNHSCTDNRLFTGNSPYKTNLKTLLSSLPNNTDRYGFYSSSAGDGPDKANAIVLCRGDLDLETCRSCINASSTMLQQYCPNRKEAIIWLDSCMLRYSDKSIYGVLATNPHIYLVSQNGAQNGEEFNQELMAFAKSLQTKAASGSSRRKYAAEGTRVTETQMFATVQCTPDLSEQNCSNCLSQAFAIFPSCCSGKLGGRVYLPSCYFHYENFRFFDDDDTPPDPPPGAPPPRAPRGKNRNKTRTAIISVPTIVFVIAIVSTCIFLRNRKKRKQRTPMQKIEIGGEISDAESLRYDFSTISIATDNFSDANRLGQGGFGTVYKGKLSSGQDIAVKRLSKDSGQGEVEFMNEVILLAKLHHRNLVRLLSFCLEGTERLLIYEFVSNSSLDRFIFDPNERAHLDWKIRFKITEGIARGLQYLHEDSRLRIIHRDLKASNILLDGEMNPKISDFGMARLFELDETRAITKRVVGTFGYIAPEYAMHGYFSVKSDVFSFGVLTLEIVSGQRNNYFLIEENVEDLLSYVWKSWRDGTVSNLIDPSLRTNDSSSIHEILRCIHIGLLCVQENVAARPTMKSVLLMLNRFSITLPVPLEPAFFLHSHRNPEMPLLEKHSSFAHTSLNDASISELYPR